MLHGSLSYYNTLHSTLHRVLADSLLQYFFPHDGSDLENIRHCVLESVKSCDASKQLLQGEKEQQFYVKVMLNTNTFLGISFDSNNKSHNINKTYLTEY
jgi:hypothetical protein